MPPQRVNECNNCTQIVRVAEVFMTQVYGTPDWRSFDEEFITHANRKLKAILDGECSHKNTDK